MIELVKQSLLSQYEAALSMLRQRIDACPEEYWDAMVGQGTFRQDAYHVLFWMDYYLSPGEERFSMLEHHVEGGDEREPVISRGLDKMATLLFLANCHKKLLKIIESETETSLSAGSGFPSIFVKRPLNRIELHLYNIRHLQHHTGQLSLVLSRLAQEEGLDLPLPWIGADWR